MAATKTDIAVWLKEGKQRGATHTMIVCDTFSYEDYPVHVNDDENVHEKYEKYRKMDMTRVMEVYSHALGHADQLEERRAFHF